MPLPLPAPRAAIALLALLALALSPLPALAQPAPSPHPSPDRFAHLARGVNLSRWLSPQTDKDPAKRLPFISQGELNALSAAGFTCVRLPIDPGLLWDPAAHTLRPAELAPFRAALDRILAAGLSVVVDMHPHGGWETPSAATARSEEYERFWSALAAELNATDPGRVFLEIMNEPHDLKDHTLWPRAQAALVKVIRAAAPHHTIVVTGDDWGGVEGLLRLHPLNDPNLLYSFHFYEPHIFTHQGASWGWEGWRDVHALKYPAQAANVASVVDHISNQGAQNALLHYTTEYATSAGVRDKIASVAGWAKANNIKPDHLWCGEFGVYAAFAPRQSRLNWLRDVTSALNEHGIGWAMWDYCAGFDLATGAPGKRVIDADVLHALIH